MEKVTFDVRYRAVLYSALLFRLDFRFYSLMFFLVLIVVLGK